MCPAIYEPCARKCDVRVICRCLNVTEEEIVSHIGRLGLRTLEDVRCHTGAGDGCTACHCAIRECLEAQVQTEDIAIPA